MDAARNNNRHAEEADMNAKAHFETAARNDARLAHEANDARKHPVAAGTRIQWDGRDGAFAAVVDSVGADARVHYTRDDKVSSWTHLGALVGLNDNRGALSGWRIIPVAPITDWKIEVEWSENTAIGAVAEAGVTWDSFAAFTSFIAGMAHTTPISGGYDKTGTRITHIPSGETYSLRLDITHPCSNDTSDNDLLERVKSMCLYMLSNDGANLRRFAKDDGDFIERITEYAKWAERFLAAE